ncbi:MAG: peptidylprolyl isomerase [Lachnospiraceae bacterium]|nr:peptidylprolyl isomerase [Butyrivibrio sp.]MCM1342894.1 peptidylprolyl isomerase [Muribaculaceae bacterium]MCM1411661.1 peptidylprolyl isomerase [Lachnospiraceae bacterium]
MGSHCKGYGNRWRYARTLAAVTLAAIMALAGLTACGGDGSGTKVVFTTGFDKDEVFRIGSVSCTVPEVMVYLTTTQNQYESVYGPEVWNVALDGMTLEENVKETVLAKIAQIKTMYLLAGEKEVALDAQEREKVRQAAEDFFRSLNDRERELMGADMETIEQLYTEYALADKVYQYIIQDVNPEISDDEARTITVQHILIRTYTTDGAGSRVPLPENLKQAVYSKALEVREMAVNGENDFVDLASRYSEDPTITYSFGKGEMDAAFEEAAFALETGEISQVVESESGYHIIKCINTFDREQTDISKQQIVEERRREVFGQEYDEFVDTLVRNLNTKLWEEIALIHDPEVTTTGFFEIYAEYFS